ncbi:molecular chaperone (plasmid) [Klebsiella michiganensis]|uniref:fimbrial biogenesis chaperone n=1 Tax=Klebsiella michiganensis TaxID=1134687 RepID=UPI00265AC442|nr:molecular chaperone [Klebsiella michiganensis]WKJ95773.1 molecular chaperone [Klebsiella michiganensis]WKK00963.1 molecular chaperone [Klebsiella michiganensis]WKK02881.1 molecular chaperone [Klebsiella michiganensis]WKK06998.1 molecular chaperone [Klebsiella michiganensis]
MISFRKYFTHDSFKRLFKLVFIAALFHLCTANSATSLNRTRVIISGQEREASLQVLNEGKRPILIQNWVDYDILQAQVERINLPFVVDPPMVRIEPGQSRQLRILIVKPIQFLDKKTESLFWLNILEIPPKLDGNTSKNHIQIGFRTRVKIFVRPEKVAKLVPSDFDDLSFDVVKGEGDYFYFEIKNPAPIHRSFNYVNLVSPEDRIVKIPVDIVRPFERKRIPIEYNGNIKQADGWKVVFSAIDDFGVGHEKEERI